MLAPGAAADADVVAAVAALVNGVYSAAEGDLWLEGRARTTAADVARFVAAAEMSVARTAGDDLLGCVRIETVDAHTALFGMLAVDPTQRGAGLGRALVDHAEAIARARGCSAMRLELLVPRGRSHPSKDRLARWYGALGYAVDRVAPVEDVHAFLLPHLAEPCDLQLRSKVLG